MLRIKPGAVVSEQELLDFAARTIPERAAVPKRIRISAALPMTAVGKLFKPALQQLEVEETVREPAKRWRDDHRRESGARCPDRHDCKGGGSRLNFLNSLLLTAEVEVSEAGEWDVGPRCLPNTSSKTTGLQSRSP